MANALTRASRNRRVALLVAMLLAAAAGVAARQQLTPYLPPPEGSSVYDILDFGPAPAIQCTCVPNPFAVPSYRPGWGYGSGPAVPMEDAPISEADRRTNRDWYEQEAQLIRRVSDEALGGNNPIASLAVAMHFSARKAIFGDDR